jgi:hypothetical protein
LEEESRVGMGSGKEVENSLKNSRKSYPPQEAQYLVIQQSKRSRNATEILKDATVNMPAATQYKDR